ncbi:MAG TPA: acyltransferase domain-containing protein, partial [Myxococcota bacterium]|nr:acyltransferase domain-containing protein [Myxococcota bacterium]
MTVTLSLRDAVKGAKPTVELKARRACPDCNGTGSAMGKPKGTCPDCHGTGRKSAKGAVPFSRTCDRCNGTGKAVLLPCSACDGVGARDVSEKLRVTVPPGVDEGSRILSGLAGEDLRGVLYPAEETEGAQEKLNRTEWTQPALYVMEYALCQLWKSWGVEAEGMVGHSIGEYVAATEAGVMSFADGVRVVTERGRLMQGLEAGRMLAVMLGREEVEGLVKGAGVEVAAYNGAKQSVVSGSVEAIGKFASELKARGVGCKELATSHAFHSVLVEPVLGKFLEVMKGVELKEPQKRYVSNVSGKWVKGEEARSAEYWVKHLRRAVDFAGAVEELEREEGNVYVEVGPGRTLVQLVKQGREEVKGVASQWKGVRREMLESLGQLWCWGVEVDWAGVHGGRKRLKVPLPTYAFQRQKYWVERQAGAGAATAPAETAVKKPDIADW